MINQLKGYSMDRLFYNGIIRTMNDDAPTAQAVGIKNGKIVFVGSNEEAAKLNAAEKINLMGKAMFPGFNETHMHMAMYAFAYANVRMFDCKSVEECLAVMKKKFDGDSSLTWIYGRGWNEQNFTSGEKRYHCSKPSFNKALSARS